MKLIQQTVLVFTAGRTEKVYEIDLCEVGGGQYVVNFRYGRRGRGLKDGSKTVLPVSLSEAQSAYNKLRSDKMKAGYKEGGTPTPTSNPSSPAGSARRPAASTPPASRPAPTPLPPRPSPGPSRRVGLGPRERAVLDRLERGELPIDRGVTSSSARGRARRAFDRVRGSAHVPGGKWKLTRAIWRAGEMKIKEAEPALLRLIGSARPMRDYCIAWALGFCGSSASIPYLNHIFTDSNRADADRRIAAEALLRVYDKAGRAAFVSSLIDTLPYELRDLARQGTAESFKEAMRGYLNPEASADRFVVLGTLYQINNERVRPAIIDVVKNAPMKPPWFRELRHIFKAAEYRRDAEVFGLLAYRFSKSRAMYRTTYRGGTYARDITGRRRYYNANEKKQALASKKAKIAYGDKTRWYMRRRVWWTLDRMAQLGDPDYVKMAVGVLLPFKDSDAKAPRTTYQYSWRRGSRSVDWDSFATYWAFNHILYTRSSRYEVKKGDKVWRCKGNYKPGGTVPSIREEAYPQLWDSMPQGLFHLLDESRCEAVHQFAARALRANRAVTGSLDADAIAMLLSAPYEVTASLGLELAQRRYNPSAPSRAMLLAAATSVLKEARDAAHIWFDEGRAHFLSDGVLLATLMTCQYEDTRWIAREVIDASTIPDHAARGLIGRLVAHMMGLGGEDGDVARDVSDLMVRRFGHLLPGLSQDVIRDLLNHPLAEVQAFGADIILARPGEPLVGSDIVQRMLGSEHALVRGRGVMLLGRFSDHVLLGRQELLMILLLHDLSDVRDAVRPIVARLCGAHPIYSAEVVRALIDILIANKVSEDIAAHVSRVLREDLAGKLTNVSKELVWKLLTGPTGSAQEVGGVLLGTHINPDSLSISEMVELSDHEILSVRDSARGMMARSLGRVKNTLGEAVGVLDSRWEDSRAWAFAFFRDNFSGDDWTPGVLVSICDSVREDVQRFGREMITRHFKEEDGQLYMLHLSEHPSTDLQLFVTNYLERYATGSPQRLEELAPYFKRVLCGVNRGRTAKKRIFSFLKVESMGGEACAAVVAQVLYDVSATIAVESRAEALEVLLLLHRVHPAIDVPIRVVPIESRGSQARGGV